jgi:hypothetical protein
MRLGSGAGGEGARGPGTGNGTFGFNGPDHEFFTNFVKTGASL